MAAPVGRILVTREELDRRLRALSLALGVLNTQADRARSDTALDAVYSARERWLYEAQLAIRGTFDEETVDEALRLIAADPPVPLVFEVSVDDRRNFLLDDLRRDGAKLDKIGLLGANCTESEGAQKQRMWTDSTLGDLAAAAPSGKEADPLPLWGSWIAKASAYLSSTYPEQVDRFTTCTTLPPQPLLALANSTPKEQQKLRTKYATEAVSQKSSEAVAFLNGIDLAQQGSPTDRDPPVMASGTRSAGVRSWVIVEQLSGGKQGTVSLVHREGSWAERGVLKKVAAANRDDPRAFERLKREIKMTRELQHPCIIRILDADLEAADPWIVTEWAACGSAQKHLDLFKGDAWRTLRVARDIASGLSAVHARGIVHRDIKPMNIFLHTPDRAVIGDFGIAHAPDDETLTATGEPVGGWFRPPEAEIGRIDQPEPSFDVYSLGKLIYYLLSGGHRYMREYFDRDDSNLVTRLDRPDFVLVNHLLGQMVVEDPKGRLSSMERVIRAIDETIACLFGSPGPISNLCFRCRRGKYVLTGAMELVPPTDIRLVEQPGKTSRHFNSMSPMLFACSNCGDIRMKFANPALLPKPT